MVHPNLGQGGAEMQLMHLARGLAERGDEVTVACLQRAYTDVSRLREAGVRLVEFGADSRRAKVGTLPALFRLSRAADLVHTALLDAAILGRVAGLMAGRPVTTTEHASNRSRQFSVRGAPRERMFALHHRLLGPVSGATIACAESQIQLLLREGVPARRMALIYNAVPVAELRRQAEHGVSRADLGIPDEALVVMQVARLQPQKGQLATLAAVAALRESLGDVHAVFVGTGPDHSAEERAGAMGADWAHFLGGRDDVPHLLTLTDLAVLPSTIDAYPMAALEAMALGVPQVTSNAGDLALIMERSGGGLSFAASDQPAFEAACRRLLTDADERRRLGEQAARSAWRWDVDTMVDRYSEVFDAVLARRPLPESSRPAFA